MKGWLERMSYKKQQYTKRCDGRDTGIVTLGGCAHEMTFYTID